MVKLGDILEWLAGASLVGAAIVGGVFGSPAWIPLTVLGLFLGYQAQGYAHHPLPRLRRPKAVEAEAEAEA